MKYEKVTAWIVSDDQVMIKVIDAVTAPKSMDAAEFLREQAGSAGPDVLRAMVKKAVAEALMSAEADAICGAPYGQRGDERVNCAMATGRGVGYGPGRWELAICEAAVRLLLPGLVVAASSAGGAGPG